MKIHIRKNEEFEAQFNGYLANWQCIASFKNHNTPIVYQPAPNYCEGPETVNLNLQDAQDACECLFRVLQQWWLLHWMVSTANES